MSTAGRSGGGLRGFVYRRFPNDRKKARSALLLVWLLATVVVFCAFFIPCFFILDLLPGIMICLYGFVSAVITLWVLLGAGRVRFASQFFCATVVVYFTMSIYLTNGIRSPFVPWLVVAPVSACMLFGWRSVLFWSALVLTELFAWGVLALFGYYGDPELFFGHARTVTAFGYCSFLLYTLVIILAAERTRRAADRYRRVADLEQVREREDLTQLIAGRELERQRIAREIHDGLSSDMTALRLRLRAAYPPGVGPEQAREDLFCTVNEAAQALARLSRSLSTHLLRDFGLGPAVGDLCERFAERTGCLPECLLPGASAVHADYAVHIYRMIAEALDNVARHAEARHVTVQLLAIGGLLRLMVEDDGKGMAEITEAGGLREVRELAEAMGGELIVESSPGRGVTLLVEANTNEWKRSD